MSDSSTPAPTALGAASFGPAPEVRGKRSRVLPFSLVVAETWRSTAHLVGDLFLGIAAWSALIPLIVIGVALTPVFGIGIPVLWVTLLLVRVVAWFERRRVGLFLDVTPPTPGRAPARPGLFGRIRRDLTEPSSWRTIAYLLLRLPTGAIGGGALVALWAWGMAMTSLPLYGWALPDGDWLRHDGWWTALWCSTGVVSLLLAPYVALLTAGLDRRLAMRLLGRTAGDELRARVVTLTETRTGAMDAADAERARIERDLHDGAQQRLVALAMNLGRAQARFDSDPKGAAALVAEAHSEAKQALGELRDLVRGFQPAVLADRGLDAALSALAARSPVPVTLDVELAERCDPSEEAVAYFVVAESLTNAAKHSGASAVQVTVRRHRSSPGNRLHLEISDDGGGGAVERPGGGLAGLRARVAAVDGTLTLHSPAGGPTTVTVVLPCAR